jgi:hypothetical protein
MSPANCLFTRSVAPSPKFSTHEKSHTQPTYNFCKFGLSDTRSWRGRLLPLPTAKLTISQVIYLMAWTRLAVLLVTDFPIAQRRRASSVADDWATTLASLDRRTLHSPTWCGAWHVVMYQNTVGTVHMPGALYRHFDKDASDKLTHGFLQFRDQAIVYFETFRF